MFKGFYNLTSGMLSQGRRLDVVANNMTNVSTAGFKADIYTDIPFEDILVSRTGNRDKTNPAEIGPGSYVLAPSRLYTDYGQGAFDETGLPLDFAIDGDGFFAVRDDLGDGQTYYTRAGNFSLDTEGYLCLADWGRVLDQNGEPLQLLTDKIRGDGSGALYTEDGGYLGQLGVYAFADNGALAHTADGFFVGDGATATANVTVRHKMLERANIDLVHQMTEMMSTQRALQSAAQMSKMYDALMTKVSSDIGRL